MIATTEQLLNLIHFYIDEQAENNIRLAVQAGNAEKAGEFVKKREALAFALTGPMGEWAKPLRTRQTSKRPPRPYWYRAPEPTR